MLFTDKINHENTLHSVYDFLEPAINYRMLFTGVCKYTIHTFTYNIRTLSNMCNYCIMCYYAIRDILTFVCESIKPWIESIRKSISTGCST